MYTHRGEQRGYITYYIHIICLSTEKLCCELPDPTYGKVRVKSRTDGSTAFYSCDRGYKLSGDKTRTCDDGDWRGEEPCCIGKASAVHTCIYYCY